MLGNRFLTLLGVVALVVLFLFGTFQVFAGPSPTPQTPISTDTAIAPSFSTGQVSMNATAKVIKAAPTTGHARFSIRVYNTGSATIYLGSSNATSTTTGFPLPASTGLSLDRSYSSIYGVCSSGSNSTAAYLEEAR